MKLKTYPCMKTVKKLIHTIAKKVDIAVKKGKTKKATKSVEHLLILLVIINGCYRYSQIIQTL